VAESSRRSISRVVNLRIRQLSNIKNRSPYQCRAEWTASVVRGKCCTRGPGIACPRLNQQLWNQPPVCRKLTPAPGPRPRCSLGRRLIDALSCPATPAFPLLRVDQFRRPVFSKLKVVKPFVDEYLAGARRSLSTLCNNFIIRVPTSFWKWPLAWSAETIATPATTRARQDSEQPANQLAQPAVDRKSLMINIFPVRSAAGAA